jgi:hypothetical protein
MIPGLNRPGAQLLAMAIIVVVTVAGSYFLWHKYSGQIVAQSEFILTADRIEVPAQPNWITADVKAEAFLRGSLKGLSIREPDATVRVAQAFAMHSWVAKVNRVSKHYPASVVIDLDYRRPVAMVWVPRELLPVEVDYDGLFPVDSAGYLLPFDDFYQHSPEQLSKYPRILAGNATPSGPPGTPWGDRRIVGAARIASVLQEDWTKLRLHRIVVADDSSAATPGDEPVYELRTRNGVSLIWGHAPGNESSGEVAADRKTKRLRELAEAHGSLEEISPQQPIDLSGASQPPVVRTARETAD